MDKKTAVQLKSVDLKITEPRKAILNIFTNAKKPIDAEKIVSQLKSKNISIDQATVYRILKTFTDKNILHKIMLQEGKTHYELLDRPHHHHIICTACGNIEDIEECSLEQSEKEIQKETGFTVQSHSFELFGLCPSCQ